MKDGHEAKSIFINGSYEILTINLVTINIKMHTISPLNFLKNHVYSAMKGERLKLNSTCFLFLALLSNDNNT